MVDLVSASSKRSDLLVDLDHAAQQLGQANSDAGTLSVRSTGRVGRAHSLEDRLTDAAVQKVILKLPGRNTSLQDRGAVRHQREERGSVASEVASGARWHHLLPVFDLAADRKIEGSGNTSCR